MSFADWSNEKKRKQKEAQEEANNTQAVLGGKTSFSDWSNSKKAESVDEDFINTFIKDANTFLGSIENQYNSVTWGNASSAYNTVSTTWKDLSSRANTVSAWLNRNKDNVDEETYKRLASSLDSISNNSSSAVKAFESLKNYYAQWDSEDAYNSWYKTEEERNSVLGAEDFEEYYQIGKTDDDDNDFIMEIFDNPVGESNYIEHYRKYYGDDPNHKETYGAGVLGKNASYALAMTDEEVKVYDYYLGKYGEDRAEEYLDSIKDTLNQRVGSGLHKTISGNEFLEITFAVSAGLDQFASGIGNLDNLIMGTEADPTSAMQYASSMIREDIDGAWGVAYDLANTLGNQLPSILVSTVVPVAGQVAGVATMGVSATGNAYAEMRNLGYDANQARAYAAMVGVSEAGLQYALGGIGKLGGKLTGKRIVNLASKFDSAIARTAIQVGGKMASEAFEEGAQTVLESAFKALATGEDFEMPEWEDVFYSALLGALSAGTLEGVPTIAGTAINSHSASVANGKLSLMEAGKIFLKTHDLNAVKTAFQEGKKAYAENSAAYVNEALEIDPENAHAQRMQARLDDGKSVSGYQLNRLVEANEQALYKQDKGKIASSVAERLTRLGEEGDVGKLSEVIAKKIAGEKLSMSEKTILKDSWYGNRVINEMTPSNMESGEYTSKWAENIGTERIGTEAYNKVLYDLASEQAGVAVDEGSHSVAKNTTEKETATEAKFEVSTDGKTKVGDMEVSIKEIASIKDGEIMLRLEDGSTVKASDVEFGSNGEGLLYENVVHMNLNPATANAFIKGYDPSMSVQEYALGFREAYQYGEYGFPVREMSTDGFSARLSESQKSLAYNLGKTDAKYKIDAKQKSITEKSSATVSKKEQVGKRKGKLHNSITPSTERQKASLKALGVLADTLGIDIYTFESDVVDGKRKGANGWFDRKDGSLHIDIHAGINGEGTMLFTAAHELTHFIREWSPAKFKVFADFLLEQYGKKGISVDALVREQIEKAKRNGRNISYDTAYEEVIADSCEAMLADGDAITKIAELKAKDKTLYQKIKDFLTNLVARIKAVYEGMTPDSVEGRFVSEMLDSAEKLKALWTEALAEASDNYTSAEKTLVDNGIAVDSNTESASLMSVRDLLNSEQQQKVAETLATRFGVTVKEAKAWISAETSLASLILNPKYSQYLDYTADANEEAIKSNSDYPQGTVDFSNICKKRRDFTEVMNRVLRNFPNHVFEATDLAKIRTIMMEEGMEVACGICYVEDRRQLDSVVAQDFIDSLALYREGSKTRPDGKPFNANQLKALKLIDGDSYIPSIYELISLEGRNSLKAKNPAMEEAWVKFNNARGMQSVRLLLNDAEYKRQILDYKPSVVKRKNDLGGLRIYSFSDAEMFHLIDIIQVITDSATVGLSLQGYTKVNEYAKAVKDTGEKLNRSLIPKGDLGYHMEGGKVVLDYDTVEGIDVNHPDFFDNIDNPNIGNTLIGINKTQIKAAMVSKFVDQIIPFHTGQSNEVLGEKGIATWANYKDFQSERDLSTGKKSSHQINIYTEVIQAAEAEGKPITNKVDFVNQFLEVCKENNLEPRFSEFLNVDENGDYVYTEGYHKFLVDFKTFDQNTGEYLPQMPVKPIFDNEYITGLLKDYVKSQKAKDANLAKAMPKVLDRITNEIVKPNDVKLSDRDSSYMDAVKRGDMDTAQKMVDEAAKAAGYDVKGFHATNADFTVFDIEKTSDINFHGRGIYFTNSQRDVENNYENYEGADPWNKIEARAYELAYDKYGLSYEDTLTSDSEIIDQLNECYDEAIDEFKTTLRRITAYLKFDNPLIIGKNENARDYDLSQYDGIIDNHVYENIGHGGMDENTVHYVVLNPHNIKSAAPVTYDDNGNVIPLSERFNSENSDIRYSDRADIVDVSGKEYDHVIELDYKTFNKVKRSGQAYINFIRNNLVKKKITVQNSNGDLEVIEFAKSNERVRKDGSKNFKRVLGELEQARNEIKKLVILNAEETTKISKFASHKDEHSHQWLDENGWDKRESYVLTNDGVIYPVDLHIAKTYDGRNILYDANVRIKEGISIDKIATSMRSNKNAWQAVKLPKPSDETLYHKDSDFVKREFSDRDTDSVSNRSLLANALESVAQNDIEKNKLNEYKRKISLIESEQAKLAELRAKIKELSFAKGARDTKTIKSLQFEANQTANRINTYDKQLLNLEATKALKDVLQREKQMAYKRAEQRGKEALAAYRERATKTQRELMTRYQESRKKGVDGRKKTAMRHKIKDVVSELNQYLLKGTKDKHVPIELQKAVAKALDAVNMDTVGAEKRLAEIHEKLQKDPFNHELLESYRRISEQGERMDGKLQALKNAYDDIVNSDDPLIANSHDEVISNSIAKVIKEVGNTPLRDMSLAQLESVYDLYKMVLTTIRNTNKAFKAAKSEEISVIANRVMEEIDKLGKKKTYRSKASQTASKFDWNNLKPVYAFERIGSNTFTEVFNNVRAGEDTWAVDVTEAKDFSKEQRKKFKYDSWDFNKRFGFTSSSGMNFELSLEQMMSLYAFSKREQARDHLKKGGIVFDETTEVTIKNKIGIPVKFNPTEATAYNLSDETLADIVGKLTEDQKAFVDAMQDYLSTTMGDKGNEVSLALYGVKLYKEKHYFPLKSATQFMAKAKEQQNGEVKVKNSGFSKETTPKANNPIVLTPFMDVWADHVNDMSMYHAFVLPLEDFYRVYNYKTPTSDTMATESVEMYLQNSFGKGATQYIDQLLKDLNGGARTDSTTGFINKMTGVFKKSAVFGSLSVVIQQPSAIARATALIDTKYFVGKPSKGKHKETWVEIKKYAPVAVIKEMGYFDTGMGQSTVDWIKDKHTWKDKVDDWVSKAPALADELAWCAIWKAVKRETLHTHKDLTPNSKEFLNAVGERFTEVITKTQVYDSVLARSAYMRSKDSGTKMATAFMAEPTTSINMIENAFTQLKRGDKRYARKAIGSVVASMILNSILVSFVYAGRDDDEEKTYAEKYVGTLTEELIDSINPLTLIPFAKDIISIMQGYDVERSDMAVITDLINAWNNLDSDNRSVYRKVEDFAGAIASIFGLPVKNIMRDARGMFNTVNSFINGEQTTGAGIKTALVEAVTGDEKSNGQQLYEAMLAGDTAQIERVKGRFKDQKAINSAIRTALRDNDTRIKEAAEARYNGDIAEYMRIAKSIIAEGHFKQDDVVAAINSEINALKPDEDSSASSDNAKSIYKVSDYYTALVGRDQATAYVVKEDLIKTDVANGKDRDEAEADFNSKFASHLRDLHEKGELSDYDAENMLVNYGGKTYEQANAKVQYWNFREKYPDYDLSEEAVTKYYEDVEPYGIGIGVYYDYSKSRAKCNGIDSDGDGRADSGTVKSQVMDVIDSLPISNKQKDALYYLNGWSANTIYEAPWH